MRIRLVRRRGRIGVRGLDGLEEGIGRSVNNRGTGVEITGIKVTSGRKVLGVRDVWRLMGGRKEVVVVVVIVILFRHSLNNGKRTWGS